jgi:deoxycytidylate deaminase
MNTYPKMTARVYDKRGRLLSEGTNFPKKTHPKQAQLAAEAGEDYKIYLHAEVSALVKIRKGVPHKIQIERYGADGRPLTAKPCAICELAIREAGIKLVEYTIG